MNDFNLDDSNSLQIFNGDFLVRDTSAQDCKLIVTYHPGHLKSDPTLGVGLENSLNGQLSPTLRKTINRELNNDGYKLKDAYFDENGELQILI